MSIRSNNRDGSVTTPTPVPLGKIALLGTILLANNASIWMIFSFLPFMVAFFYPTLNTTELGFEAGILGSAFSAGGLLGNFVSGIISDRVGRRPALMWGLGGTAISALCFGFAPTFWFAVSARFMWGVLNGNIGVAKTYLAEISDDTNMARGMSYFGVIGSVGRVVGPMIGGLLSYPAKSFPAVFGNTAFETYPFALPSLVITLNCLVILVITYFWLPETLVFKGPLPSRSSGGSAGSVSASVSGMLGSRSNGSTSGGVQYSALHTSDDNSIGGEDDSNAIPVDNREEGAAAAGNDNADAIELTSVVSSGRNGATAGAGTGTGTSNPLNSNNSNNSNNSSLSTDNLKAFKPLKTESRSSTGVTDEETDSEVSRSEYGEAGTTAGMSRSALSRSSQQRPQKRSISFSSLVTVKEIDTTNIVFKTLKQVAANDVPITHQPVSPYAISTSRNSIYNAGNGNASSSINGSAGNGTANSNRNSNNVSGGVNQLEEGAEGEYVGEEGEEEEDGRDPTESLIQHVRYTNGSEFFESVDSRQHRTVSGNIRYLLRQRHVFITTTLYGTSSFLLIIGNEIFTLWVVTSRSDGGLNYNTEQIGSAVMACGLVATVLQLTLYPYAVERLGVLKVHRWGALMFALSCFVVPNLSWVTEARAPDTTWILVVMALTLQTVSVNWYLISVFVLISNSCYSHQLATVNGIGQTCASLGRLCGPYIGSVLFAWSETNGLKWPFNYYFVYYLLCLCSLVNHQYSLYLPRSIQRRKREPRFRNYDDAYNAYLAETRMQQLQQQQESAVATEPGNISSSGSNGNAKNSNNNNNSVNDSRMVDAIRIVVNKEAPDSPPLASSANSSHSEVDQNQSNGTAANTAASRPRVVL